MKLENCFDLENLKDKETLLIVNPSFQVCPFLEHMTFNFSVYFTSYIRKFFIMRLRIMRCQSNF